MGGSGVSELFPSIQWTLSAISLPQWTLGRRGQLQPMTALVKPWWAILGSRREKLLERMDADLIHQVVNVLLAVERLQVRKNPRTGL